MSFFRRLKTSFLGESHVKKNNFNGFNFNPFPHEVMFQQPTQKNQGGRGQCRLNESTTSSFPQYIYMLPFEF